MARAAEMARRASQASSSTARRAVSTSVVTATGFRTRSEMASSPCPPLEAYRRADHSGDLVRVTETPALIRVNLALPRGVIDAWTKGLVAEHAP